MNSVEKGARELSISRPNPGRRHSCRSAQFGTRHRSGTSRAGFCALLHDKDQRNRDGTGDLSVHHRRPWGPLVGRRQSSLGAPYSSSPCRQQSKPWISSGGFTDWRAERRHRSRWSSSTGLAGNRHAILQGAVPSNLIRVCGNQNCRDRVSRIDEASMEFDARHSGHLDVSHQAGGWTARGDARKSAAEANASTV